MTSRKMMFTHLTNETLFTIHLLEKLYHTISIFYPHGIIYIWCHGYMD